MLNLLLGLMLMVLGLFLQTLVVVIALRYYTRHQPQRGSHGLLRNLLVINTVMVLLVLGNVLQITVWAWLFLSLDEFADFSTAFYHSAVNFATLGYGDIVMSETHRLLGPLQAINGVLMIGVSTAALMTAFQDALRRRAGGLPGDG